VDARLTTYLDFRLVCIGTRSTVYRHHASVHLAKARGGYSVKMNQSLEYLDFTQMVSELFRFLSKAPKKVCHV
jgi:hypothetical protein